MLRHFPTALALLASAVSGVAVSEKQYTATDARDGCPGYVASNIVQTGTGLSASLKLGGTACNVHGTDVPELKLTVNHDTGLESRLHVKIEDAGQIAYQVPTSVFPTPSANGSVSPAAATLEFSYETSPFSFKVTRRSNGEILFDTSAATMIFEDQYLRLRTALPDDPNLYGLGEHTDSLRLNTTGYTRTLWSRDGYLVPSGQNLYGNHPIYFDHRGEKGTHGVFMLSSAGMDVKINRTEQDGQYLEYNMMSGILDMYFLSGPSPIDVAKQYSEVTRKAAMMPYWGFGYHQCRYGYRDFYSIAEVVYNYSMAGIPLETMWTDIDYMYERYIMTTDPDRFPVARVREYVDYLHDHHQKYIVMVDPAVAFQTERENGLPYETFLKARDQGILLQKNGSIYQGVVWPGITAFPDWFHPDTQKFWDDEFAEFFNADTGVDIDGLWIDMNEAANFNYFGDDPQESAEERVSNFTLDTDIVHYDGHVELDVHNIYGAMMSAASRTALINRRPRRRPMVITRSTFAGSGHTVGKWLGDNMSTWELYRNSIQGMLGFAAIYQVPMVGSDVCGFAGNTTEVLCARWATLGAFNPFFRNHNGDYSSPQEFYVWASVTAAAKNAIDIRYRLLDYIYTALYQQSVDGTPLLNPMFFLYPADRHTVGVDLQFFYGDALLVSPVTEENATHVEIYLPRDTFYDFKTYAKIEGEGAKLNLTDIPLTEIPLHVRGGCVVPMRNASGATTTDVRAQPFNFFVAPDAEGRAVGRLYLDDGESLVQEATSEIALTYGDGELLVGGSFGYRAEGNWLHEVIVLGVEVEPEGAYWSQGVVDGGATTVWVACPLGEGWRWDAERKALIIKVGRMLDEAIRVKFEGGLAQKPTASEVATTDVVRTVLNSPGPNVYFSQVTPFRAQEASTQGGSVRRWLLKEDLTSNEMHDEALEMFIERREAGLKTLTGEELAESDKQMIWAQRGREKGYPSLNQLEDEI
ncbi:alpha-glucosidase [Drepanopeziza brunnea f. sp. 'multigermtubi' MB_m1]|uniref:Probable alpha/beta-glucosidase agdC n=1 Tax=Marssonina brunnea f. sp. multigermtubi (strain MB_m1) TaxID=1072389 RepID=K1WME3_MARBU|nr:alpha-glucosidase [Drepanopeziza brunnea f. sp. 'multigermtubi' MB_m1]EKD18880.1 alpha-glucosidase [Drepanopeziza brunnea f. sp. 'multigermtubi' MB_m1]